MNGHKMPLIQRPLVHIPAILLFAFLSYSNTFNVPFQLDDIGNIVFNPAIKKFDYFMDLSRLQSAGNPDVFDRPLFKTRYIGYLTFAFDHAVHGLDVRGYHLVNLLIHLCSSLLLYSLVMLTFRSPRFLPNGEDPLCSPTSRNFIAFFTALLFAVHPVQTQAVTYIVQRFASLATMLWMLSLVSYIQSRLLPGTDSGGIKRSALYMLSLISAILAMKTKEFALLLPIVIAMYDLMFLEGSLKKRFQRLTPIILTMTIVPLSLISSSVSGLGKSDAKIWGQQEIISRADYLFTQFRVIVTYIRLLLFPANQRFDYDYPIYRSFFIPEVVISFLLLLMIFLGGVCLLGLSRDSARKNRHLYRLMAFGIFWFFITISAESSIIPIADVIFEHRLYLPSIGFFLALVSAVELLRVQWPERTSVQTSLVVALMLVATGLSVATYARNSFWGDRVGFLENEVRLSPGKDRPRTLLGVMYGELGRMDEAVYQLKIATATNPKYGGAHYNLAITYLRMGRLDEAASEYKQTIALKFDYADAHASLGEIYEKQGLLEEAASEYSIALMLSPMSEKTQNNLRNVNRNLLGRRKSVGAGEK
jgi:hypothetical protein